MAIDSLTLSPTFNRDWLWYTATTTNTSDQVTAVPEDPEATVVIKLDGVTDPDGLLTWEEGENEVTVEVTVGLETAIYTVFVTKT